MPHPVGSKFSYLSHGVGQVSVPSDGKSYKMWFPLERVHITVHDPALLIPPIDATRAESVFEVLRADPQKVFPAAWVNRFRGFQAKMRSGCIEEVAEVVRDLGTKPKLTYGERAIFGDAFKLLVQQMREVYPEATEKRIRDAYSAR